MIDTMSMSIIARTQMCLREKIVFLQFIPVVLISFEDLRLIFF